MDQMILFFSVRVTCSFAEEIQSKNFNIYDVNQLIAYILEYHFLSITE